MGTGELDTRPRPGRRPPRGLSGLVPVALSCLALLLLPLVLCTSGP